MHCHRFVGLASCVFDAFQNGFHTSCDVLNDHPLWDPSALQASSACTNATSSAIGLSTSRSSAATSATLSFRPHYTRLGAGAASADSTVERISLSRAGAPLPRSHPPEDLKMWACSASTRVTATITLSAPITEKGSTKSPPSSPQRLSRPASQRNLSATCTRPFCSPLSAGSSLTGALCLHFSCHTSRPVSRDDHLPSFLLLPLQQ